MRRRFLVSYAVEPSLLAAWVPPGAELSTHDGAAWVSACFVELDDMRPSFVPRGLGSRFYYLIHRTRARLPYPDGTARESVLVLEPNLNRPVLAWLGRASTGVRFRVRDIRLVEEEDCWELAMAERGRSLFEARIPKSSIGASMPAGSRFDSPDTADGFLLGVAYGGEWDRESKRVRLLAETHDPWTATVGEAETTRFDFLERLGAQPRADHVVTMTDIPHYFALRGFDVPIAESP